MTGVAEAVLIGLLVGALLADVWMVTYISVHAFTDRWLVPWRDAWLIAGALLVITLTGFISGAVA